MREVSVNSANSAMDVHKLVNVAETEANKGQNETKEVSDNSQEQVQMLGSVKDKIDEISNVTKKNFETARDSLNSSKELSSYAEKLNDLVIKFSNDEI